MISEVILADKIQEIANKKNISINQLAHMINYSPKSLKHTLYKMKKIIKIKVLVLIALLL
ncbi:MAG: hypothetical protein PWP46_1082 [Fusobacteriaceae bacterium]|jgi:predicted transcriptional regulator|nr:hypothetical protein [Fusobacteriales bacterium]MDN5304200.1 hypothetical protein [Fusobacteriaceae bacterium]